MARPALSTAVLAVLLPAAGARAAALDALPLEEMRAWKVYDQRERGVVDFPQVCDMARLACGLVAPAGERLAAPEGPIRGQSVAALLERVLAAHPGFRLEIVDGALDALPRGDACAKALDRKAAAKRFPIVSARLAGYMLLRDSGWMSEAAPRIASLEGEKEDASFERVEVYTHKGARLRQALNLIAKTDGRMMWTAETAGGKCRAFAFEAFRQPEPVEGPSKLVSVSPR